MSRLFWDTNLFIYLIEGSGENAQRVAGLAERMLERGDRLYSSTLTLGEVLVKPVEQKNSEMVEAYERLLSTHAILIPFDETAARIYAGLRLDRTISPPDAIQLSCASAARVDLFITNDDRLSRKIIPGIQFIVALNQAFL